MSSTRGNIFGSDQHAPLRISHSLHGPVVASLRMRFVWILEEIASLPTEIKNGAQYGNLEFSVEKIYFSKQSGNIEYLSQFTRQFPKGRS